MEDTNNNRYEFVRMSNPRGIPPEHMREALLGLVLGSDLVDVIRQRGGHIVLPKDTPEDEQPEQNERDI